jgi:hypothetical protein
MFRMDLEGILVLAVYGALLLPALAAAGHARAPWVRLAVIAVWAVGMAGVGHAVVHYRQALTIRTVEPPNRPLQEPVQGYLTSDACRSCHPGEYASWHASYHRTMTQLVTPESVQGGFDGQIVEAKGRKYRFFRRGDEFWVEMDAMLGETPAGLPLPRVEQRLVLMTGSHHRQVFWFASGLTRRLELLPMVWVIDDRRWIPRSAAFVTEPHPDTSTESGRWNITCLRCHTTHWRLKWKNDDEMDTRVSEFGIACESCHGPGHDHVRHHSNPLTRYRSRLAGSQPDPYAVQPERLDPVRASQTCGQCHSYALLPEDDDMSWVENGPAYRPGDDLDLTRLVLTTQRPALLQRVAKEDPEYFNDAFWPDGVVRVSGREYNALIDSPCYVNGHGDRKLSCLSCHQMHGHDRDRQSLTAWADDQLKPGMRGDQACLQCHGDIGQRLEAHTRHSANSSGSRCYHCHMPPNTYALLKASYNHRIDSPSVQSTLQTGRPNACNQCHLDKTLEWTATHLRDWYGLPMPELSDDDRHIAASVQMLLKGDAAQRALMAWNMTWEPALQASGGEWMAPTMAQLLVDPYDAVRYIAGRSFRHVPGFETFPYDAQGPESDRRAAAQRVFAIWGARHQAQGGPVDPKLLIPAPGKVDEAATRRLLGERDHRPISIAE